MVIVGIKEAFHTGRGGKVILRGLIRIERMRAILIGSIWSLMRSLYNVNKSRLIERIAELINDKSITGIADLRDESDKDGYANRYRFEKR